MPSKANGICLRTGSLGVRAENNLPEMAERLAATKRTNPGYTAIGRLGGLAELRGAIEHQQEICGDV